MANIGLKYFKYAILTENPDGTHSYGNGKKPAKAVSCSVSITNNNVNLYADDAVAESDTGFQTGTMTLGIDDEDQTVQAELLGHTVTEGEMVRKSTDTAPYVGVGRIITKVVGGVRKYKAEVVNKVKFSEPSQDDQTKGENIEFRTSTIEGTISTLADGTWSQTKTFTTYDDAEDYIDGIFTAPTPGTGN